MRQKAVALMFMGILSGVCTLPALANPADAGQEKAVLSNEQIQQALQAPVTRSFAPRGRCSRSGEPLHKDEDASVGGLFHYRAFERDALGIILDKPGPCRFGVGEHPEMIYVEKPGAVIHINPNRRADPLHASQSLFRTARQV